KADQGMPVALALDDEVGPCSEHRAPVDRRHKTPEQGASTKAPVSVSLRGRALPFLVSIPAHPCAARSRASQRRPSLRMRQYPANQSGHEIRHRERRIWRRLSVRRHEPRNDFKEILHGVLKQAEL